MVSPNEASFDLREKYPLSRNICIAGVTDPDTRDSERIRRYLPFQLVTETG